MIHSKAIDVLKTFSKEELKQFSDFVRSPFHNKNKNLIKLYDVLKKYHPEYDVENEIIFSKIYPEKAYNHNNIKKLMSEFTDLTERFLSITGIYKEKYLSAKYLLNELLLRELKDYFLLSMKNTEINLEDNRHHRTNYKADLEQLKIEFYLARNRGIDYDECLSNKFVYNSCYYLFHLLIDCHNVIHQNNTYPFQNSNSKLLSFLNCFDFDSYIINMQLKTDQDKLLYNLLNIIRMILNPENESFYYKTKKMFSGYFIGNENEVRLDLLCYIDVFESYGTRKLRDYKLNYISELFEFTKLRMLIISNYMDTHNNITYSHFASAVHIGLYLNEIKWVEEFIVNSKRHLLQSDVGFLMHYAKGCIELEKNNYEKSLEYFSKIYYKEHLLNTMIRWKVLICYYELNLFDVSISNIDSFRHQIQQSIKFNSRTKKESNYFLNVYRELLNLKLNPDNIDEIVLKKIEKIMFENKFLLINKWIIGKIEEFRNALLLKKEKKFTKIQNSKN